MSLIQYIEDHPVVGGIIWLATVIGNLFLKINYESHIPALVMDSMQMVVWIVGILAGCLTINGWYKTHYKSKMKKITKHNSKAQ